MFNVLIVNDDIAIRKAMQSLLEVIGFNVLVAENKEQCIMQAKVASPDLILLDIMLPKLNVGEVLKVFKEDTALVKIPIIIMSATEPSSSELLKFKSDANIIAMIQKPFNLDKLMIILRTEIAHFKTD